MTKPTINYGNLEGQYFTQWRIDDLVLLANDIFSQIPDANLFQIWYDDKEDFHCMSFSVDDKMVSIRYYKLYRIDVDNETKHFFPRHSFAYIPSSIEELTSIKA